MIFLMRNQLEILNEECIVFNVMKNITGQIKKKKFIL